MRVKMQFGAINGKIREVSWNDEIMKLPMCIEFEGDTWEWITYEKGIDGIDYNVTYGKTVPSMYLGLEVPGFDQMFGWQRIVNFKCECGATYDRHFGNIHSSWCPQYKE